MATLDTSIPFKAFGQQNLLESYYQGKAMKREAALGDISVKGKQNALMAENVQALARGVLASENPARDYQSGLRQLEAMGQDVSNLPPEWGDDAEMLTRMYALPGGERTQIERMIAQLPPEQQKEAALIALGMKPKAVGDWATVPQSEYAARGLTPGMAYQMGPGDEIQQIGGGGTTVNVGMGAPESFDFSGGRGEAAQPGLEVSPDEQVAADGGDVGRALGLGGKVRDAVNVASDFFGFGQYFEETAEATSDLTFLKTEFLFATRNMINQRMSNQMLDLIDKLTVSPGAVGRDGAMLRLKNGLRLIEANIDGLQRVTDNEMGRFSKTDISNATADGILLTNLVKQYKKVIKSLEGMEAAPEEEFDLQNELPWGDDLEQLMRKYD